MDMFPYPSGAGLHVGHPLGYIGTDVVGRFRRMQGDNVLHALAFDAFGLPAEQYAVQTGEHPRTSTEANIAIMQRQLRRLGLAHDSRRSFATIDPGYVRWTQWIFLQIFDSWYDETAPRPDGGTGRARPIAELVAEYDSGARGDRVGLARRRRAPPGAGHAPPGLRLRDARQLVPRPGHGAGQRGGHLRGALRARQLPGVPAQPAAVEHADHGLRRPPGRRPGVHRLARQGQGDAAQLDRSLVGCARAVRGPGR